MMLLCLCAVRACLLWGRSQKNPTGNSSWQIPRKTNLAGDAWKCPQLLQQNLTGSSTRRCLGSLTGAPPGADRVRWWALGPTRLGRLMALGDHDHRGSVAAQLAWSARSKKWQMPSPYYSKTFQVGPASASTILQIIVTDSVSLEVSLPVSAASDLLGERSGIPATRYLCLSWLPSPQCLGTQARIVAAKDLVERGPESPCLHVFCMPPLALYLHCAGSRCRRGPCQ